MPKIEAIQVLIKIKTEGLGVLNNLSNKITQTFQKIQTLKIDDVITEPIQKAFAQIETNGTSTINNLSKKIADSFQKVQNLDLNEIVSKQIQKIDIEKIVSSIAKPQIIEKPVGEIIKSVENYGKEAGVGFGLSLASAITTGMTMKQTGHPLVGLKKMLDIDLYLADFKFNFRQLLTNTSNLLTNPTAKLNAVERFFINVYPYISTLKIGIRDILLLVIQTFSFIPQFYITRYFLSESVNLMRRLVGVTGPVLTTGERASRLVKEVDIGLHSVFNYSSRISQVLVTGVLGFFGPFAGILGKTAFLGSLFRVISMQAEESKLRLFAAFGDGKSRLMLIIIELQRMAYNALDGWNRKAQTTDILAKKLQKGLAGGKENSKFTSDMLLLSGAKFPAAQQITLVIAQVRPFMENLLKQIFVLTETLKIAFKLTPQQIGTIEEKATGSLNRVQKESKTAFDSVAKTLDKAFTANRFSRWLQTSDLASFIKSTIIFPFDFAWSSIKLGAKSAFWSITGTIMGVAIGFKSIFTLAEKLYSFFPKVGESLNKAFSGAVGVAQKSFSAIGGFIKSAFGGVANVVKGLWDKIFHRNKPPITQENLVKQMPTPSITKPVKTVNPIIPPNMLPVSMPIRQVAPSLIMQRNFAAMRKSSGLDSEINLGLDAEALKRFVLGLQKLNLSSDVASRHFKQTWMLALSVVGSYLDKNFGQIAPKIFEQFTNVSGTRLEALKNNIAKLQEKIRDLQKQGTLSGRSFEAGLTSFLQDPKAVGSRAEASIMSLLSKQVFAFLPPKTMKKSGEAIVEQLKQGIESNAKSAKNGIIQVAEAIMRPLPHSPAKEGPLTGLRASGAAIINQLTLGISSRIMGVVGLFRQMGAGIMSYLSVFTTSLFSEAKSIGDYVKESVAPIVELGHISERIGVSTQVLSGMQHAFIGIGITGQELGTTFTTLGRSISEVATTEKLVALQAVGINLDKARDSANPTLDLFYQLSDATKKFPASSVEMQRALEALGVSTQGNIVNALMMGKDAIQDMITEGVQMGAVYSDEFANMGKKFTETQNKILKIGDYLQKDFLEVVLGGLTNANEAFLAFYKDNAANIRAIARIAGEVLNIVLDMVSKFVTQAAKDPEKAIHLITQSIIIAWDGIISFLGASLQDFFDGATGGVGRMLSAMAKLAVSAPWNYIKEFGVLLWDWIEGYGNKVKLYILNLLVEIINSEVVRTGLEFLGMEDLVKAANNAHAKILKDFEESQNKNTVESAFHRAVEATRQDIAELSASFKSGWEDATDPAKIDETLNKFHLVFADIKKNFKTLAESTGFDQIFAELYDRLNQAISSANYGEQVKVIQQMTVEAQKFQETLEDTAKIVPSLTPKPQEQPKASASDQEHLKNESRLIELENDLRLRASQDLSEQRELQTQKDLDALRAKHTTELIEYRNLLSLKYSSEEQLATRLKLLEEFKKNQESEISKAKVTQRREETEKTFGFMGDIGGKLGETFSTLFEASGKRVKEFFYLEKAAALASAMVNTAMAAVKALDDPGGVAGIVMSGAISALGAAQIANISSTMLSGPQGYNRGGIVAGQGSGDTVPAMLTPNEFVQPASTVSYYGPKIMEALRNRLIPKEAIQNLSSALPTPIPVAKSHFATGGPVLSNASQPQVNVPAPAFTIVNALDPAEFGRYMATKTGQDMVLNVLQSNGNKVRKIVNNV